MNGRIKELATKISELLKSNDERCQDLLDFIEWGMKNLPKEIIENFTSNNIMNRKYNECYIQFNKQDYLWWKLYHRNNPKVILPPIYKVKQIVLGQFEQEYSTLLGAMTTDDLEMTLEEIKKI